MSISDRNDNRMDFDTSFLKSSTEAKREKESFTEWNPIEQDFDLKHESNFIAALQILFIFSNVFGRQQFNCICTQWIPRGLDLCFTLYG